MPTTRAGRTPSSMNQPHQFDQRGGRVADADDGALQQAQAVGLAHGLHGAGGVLRLRLRNHIGVADELVRGMPKCARRGRDRPEQIISTSATTGVPPRSMRPRPHAPAGVEVGQAVELEVGVGVDHAAHDGHCSAV
jgi:hypothetical protein